VQRRVPVHTFFLKFDIPLAKLSCGREFSITGVTFLLSICTRTIQLIQYSCHMQTAHIPYVTVWSHVSSYSHTFLVKGKTWLFSSTFYIIKILIYIFNIISTTAFVIRINTNKIKYLHTFWICLLNHLLFEKKIFIKNHFIRLFLLIKPSQAIQLPINRDSLTVLANAS
jgi:hypothetical protein